jgi:GH35 family endo-1,4-beta-xylanase
VKIWDAVNEMLWEAAPKNLPQRHWPHLESMDNMVDYISKVLKWAREEDPEALLCINDYGLGANNREGLKDKYGTPVSAASQRKRYVELVRRLGDAGYPPNLMGIQARPAWVFPTDQVAFYDELSEAGVPLSITEFWANASFLRQEANREAIESEEWRSIEERNTTEAYTEEEAEAMRDEFVLNYLTCAFGHPNVDSFYFWGFIGNGVRFQPGTGSGHEIQPVYEKIYRLIHEEWKTKLKLTTDREGKLRFEGFCGEYALRVSPQPGEAPALGHRFNIDKNSPLNQAVIRTVL